GWGFMLILGCRRGSAATGVRAAVGFRIVVGVVVTIVVCAAGALTPSATAAFASIWEAPAASPAVAGAFGTVASHAQATLTVLSRPSRRVRRPLSRLSGKRPRRPRPRPGRP